MEDKGSSRMRCFIPSSIGRKVSVAKKAIVLGKKVVKSARESMVKVIKAD